ncbi:hypothetical protein SLS60_007203 [Paraconiothyrium brasiliense]|uniref:Uncharacterized protein n=1 Tax=Paraconiothyrium brasiliense TaxID=300254 RepID=A0ABR3R8P9_9PLEO
MTTTQVSFPLSVTNLITPSLLDSLFTLEIPWPKESPPTATQWSTQTASTATYKTLCWDVLLALSKIPLFDAQNLDFLTLLPSPDDPSFPTQALGLLILLDQAPRHLCTNLHERWRNAFFDPLALSYSLALRALPPPHHIHTFPRWEKQGWTYEHFNTMCNFLTAPFAHSESHPIHSTHLLPEVAARRRLTEKHYGVKDVQHAHELADASPLHTSSNTLAFAELIRAWVPPEADMAETVFWWCRVKEAHTPIIRVFGRYPYRNRAMGRVSTAEEEVFLEQTGHFGVSVDEEATGRIREDVERGVWTALG